MTNKSLVKASSLIVFLLAANHVVLADPPASTGIPHQITGTVATADGKPAAGATIAIETVTYSSRTDVKTTTFTTHSDQNGAFHFALAHPQSAYTCYVMLMATTPTGFGALSEIVRSTDAATPPATITLEPLTSVRIHLLDAQGKGIPGVVVVPKFLMFQHSGIALSKAQTPQWVQTTDGSGTVALAGLPQTYTLDVDVDDTYAPLEKNGNIALVGDAATPDVTFHLNPAMSVSGTVTLPGSGKPAAGVPLEADPVPRNGQSVYSTSGPDGKYTFHRLTPGNYSIQLGTNVWGASLSYTMAARTVTVGSSAGLTGIDLPLIAGARVAGVVRDKTTGLPIAGIRVILNGPAHPSNVGGADQMETGADGGFHFRVPAGEQDLIAVDQTSTNNARDSFEVADGGVHYVDVRMTAPPVVAPVTGVVVGPDGKPVAGAEVVVGSQQPGESSETTDASGRFSYGQPGLPANSLLFAHLGGLYTSGATQAKGAGDVVLHLSPNSSASFRGTVKDDSGQPVANAVVSLIRWAAGNGSGGYTVTGTTDANGSYSLGPDYSGFAYSVNVAYPGYSSGDTSKMPGTPGKTIVFPPVTLNKADSFVGGTVVDPQGNPVAGADVSVITNQDSHATTDSKGHFHIDGVPRNKVIIEVQAPEQRFASIQETSGTDANVIKVENMAEEMAEGQRFEAAVKKDATNHGDGTDANKLLKTAEATAAASGKQVFLVFHASWCGPCFMLHRFLEDPQVKTIIDAHFVVQDLDIWERGKNHWENPGGTDIYKHYGGPNSVPYFVLLDKSGKKLGTSIHNGDNMGMPSQPGDVAFFMSTLRSAAPTLSAADEAALRAGITRTSASL